LTPTTQEEAQAPNQNHKTLEQALRFTLIKLRRSLMELLLKDQKFKAPHKSHLQNRRKKIHQLKNQFALLFLNIHDKQYDPICHTANILNAFNLTLSIL